MAATITWSQHGYYAETTGKKLVRKIKWKKEYHRSDIAKKL